MAGKQCSRKTDYLSDNPFTPVFGKVPPFIVGRSQIIDSIMTMFELPENNPDRCSLFVGARGTGKTALLTFLANEAQSRGWIVANVTATTGMLDDIYQQVCSEANHLLASNKQRELTSVNIAGVGGISWKSVPSTTPNWRSRMTQLLEELASMGTGILITVDEVNPQLDEMIQLTTVFQHFVRENRRIALLMAGLPYRINRLLTGDSTSFLRRAARYNLGSIPSFEVKEGFRLTIEDGGRTIDNEALDAAAEAIRGFPYMFQLVGYRTWNAAGRQSDAILIEDVQKGSAIAQEELQSRVFEASLAELSAGDVAFLKAMAQEDKPVTRKQLMDRLKRSSSYISTYKKRLLEAGVIEEPERGVFTFALPGFAAWLRDFAL